MTYGTGWSFFGMHFIWWFVWFMFISTIFTVYTPIPRAHLKGGLRAMDILQRRYAAGQVSHEDYERRKATLERDEPRAESGTSPHKHLI